jgi:hypothetical protein
LTLSEQATSAKAMKREEMRMEIFIL